MFVQGNLEILGHLCMFVPCSSMLRNEEMEGGWDVSRRVCAWYIQDSELQFLRGSPCSSRLSYSHIHWVDSVGLKKKRVYEVEREQWWVDGEKLEGRIREGIWLQCIIYACMKFSDNKPELAVYACNSSWSLIGSYKCIQDRPGYTSSRPTWGV